MVRVELPSKQRKLAVWLTEIHDVWLQHLQVVIMGSGRFASRLSNRVSGVEGISMTCYCIPQ